MFRMIKNSKRILALCFFTCTILTLIFCSATFSAKAGTYPDEIVKIELVKLPTRTMHMLYESPDPRGAILRIHHVNGMYQDVKISDLNYTGNGDLLQTQVFGNIEEKILLSHQNLYKLGTDTVTITYMEKSCSYDITVVENKIKSFSIKRFCDGTESICLTYEDGTSEEIEIIRHDPKEGATPAYNGEYCYQTGPLHLKDRILFEMHIKYVFNEKATTYTLRPLNDSFVVRDVDDRAHHFGDWYETTPATCAKSGFETRKCADCDESESRKTEPSKEHTFGAWTTTAEGTESRTCSGCSHVETRAVAENTTPSTETTVTGSQTAPPSTDTQTDEAVTTDSAEENNASTDSKENTTGLREPASTAVTNSVAQEETSVTATVIITATATSALAAIGGCLWKFLLHKKM